MVHNPKLLNRGPKPAIIRQTPLKVLHWNPDYILAHNGIRIRCIEALNLIHKYNLIAITESALHKSTSDDDIQLDGFLPLRADLPDDATHGGVLLYYRDNLAVRKRPQ